MTVQEFVIDKKYLMILKDGSECVVVCTYTDHKRDTFECHEPEVDEETNNRIFSTRNDTDILDVLEIQPLYTNLIDLFYK